MRTYVKRGEFLSETKKDMSYISSTDADITSWVGVVDNEGCAEVTERRNDDVTMTSMMTLMIIYARLL